MIKKMNEWLADRLSYYLSTMALFYGISFLVLAPLFFQRPSNLVGWMQYIVAVFFQGVALPVLGYTSRKSGDIQAKLLQETHDTVMKELAYIKEQQVFANEERETQRKIIMELQEVIREIHKNTLSK